MSDLRKWLGIEERSKEELFYIATKTALLKLESISCKIKSFENFNPYWYEPRPIDKVRIAQKSLGVYKIIYRPSNRVMSVGQGIVCGRRNRHVSVFKNKGADIVSKSGATSPSTTARHMYNHDSNLQNWWFSWCFVEDKFIIKFYENALQKELNPPFNSLHMGGNN